MSENEERRSKKKSTFRTSPLEINGQNASRLVGGIVEKGFSSHAAAPPLPRPTVLPFPAARHRSHGPHWNSAGGGGGGRGDDDWDMEDAEEEGFSGYESAAAFAQPMHRKEKKNLNFTKWRDLMGSDKGGALLASKKVKNKNAGTVQKNQGFDSLNENNHVLRPEDVQPPCALPVSDGADEMDTDAFESVKDLEEVSAMVLDGEPSQISVTYNLGTGYYSNQLINKNVGSMSLQSEIDAENRARLERMSSIEIAEAHAEIKAKLSPSLIEKLRKRGKDKLRRKNHSASNMAARSTKVVGSSILTNPSGHSRRSSSQKVMTASQSDISNKAMTADSKERQQDLGFAGQVKLSSKSSSLWDSWSRRVEHVREIRFSVDGDVMKSARFGNSSARGGYNVSERDFLRTEGDPAATGYTIKEAIALTRSVVPGQRVFALQLIASILDRAIYGIFENKDGCTLKFAATEGNIDWEAIWAFALGPEPELALSLRLCLDDNHNSVVLACAKVIRSILSCDLNESFFDASEKLACVNDDVYTAAVFRTKSDMDVGFLPGGFWKYSAKQSNLLPFADEVVPEEDEHTIQDDVVVAGQDVAAGLVRMGVLERVSYLLETQSSAALKECLLLVLIAIARHSPTSATAICKCNGLVQAIGDRFISEEQMKITPSKIKSVIFLKVLAKVDKTNCLELIKTGTFQKLTWHLVQYSSLDQWIRRGTEACKLSSALLVEQLRLWKVCISYGHCVSYFADLFPALSVWLSVPSFKKLIENEVLSEFAAISKEAYLVLQTLTKRLPNFYSSSHTADLNVERENWCWSCVGPLVDLALDWTSVKDILPISSFVDNLKEENEYNTSQVSSFNSILWVISSVIHTISGVLEAVIPVDNTSECSSSGCLPWLPDFVPKIGLTFIKNGFFIRSSKADAGGGSFLRFLGHLRHKFGLETSLASASCLQGLVQVAVSVDKLIQLAKREEHNNSSLNYSIISNDEQILANGLFKSSVNDLIAMFASIRPNNVQLIETFGRGGPAPGVGVGWGASGGGFWSKTILLAQVDARLITSLVEVFQNFSVEVLSTVEQLPLFMQMMNSTLGVCLAAGPRDRLVVDKLFDTLLHIPLLKCLDIGIHQTLCVTESVKLFNWKYEEEDFPLFSAVLASHFKGRWLSVKTKSKATEKTRHAKTGVLKKGNNVLLDTIYEESDSSSCATSLTQQWAYQKLPLPNQWFLSPISIMHNKKDSSKADFQQEQAVLLEVAKAGLFFLLGLESTSAFLTSESYSFIQAVPVVWKLHALSVILIDGMAVLEDQKSKDVYQTLQNVYGEVVDNLSLADTKGTVRASGLLLFESEVNENYCTFVEMLVEQFAAESYGDLVFGRQVSVYLQRHVEASVKLATWNALFNVRTLDLLPTIDSCFGRADGYLEPVEDDEKLLEAYVKSWVSGGLDKAASRRSVTYTLALHHLSSFIFGDCTGDKLLLRNQLAKSLLRDYSRNLPQRQGMMMSLVEYKKKAAGEEDLEVKKRLLVLKDACGGESSLLKVVEKLQL